ncbi:hypothetical protein [Thermoproteus tenax]|uniref:Uncharacterized protein n=2 Tax=Thermoproteus tenax TaxID=2271 RepID=G4RPR7_THETK|nr:hypothetical protein [Thermoproteus tenax]CCC81562.1 conserved hypothetical protein [Thermoproteus tenax Kra 1]
MILAYARGPPIAIFAGSWLCTKSPVDGTPVALGEPIGDCENADRLAQLSSLATAVYMIKSRGVKVYYGGSSPEEELAAYAGGADGTLSEIKHRFGVPDQADDAALLVVEADSLEELRRYVRRAGEVYRRRVEVALLARFEAAVELGQYISSFVITKAPDIVSFEPATSLPEIGRCIHCGVDFLMYGAKTKRCIYCGRALRGVITQRKPTLRPEILRAIHRKLADNLPKKIVVI